MYRDIYPEISQQAFPNDGLPDDPAAEMDSDFQRWMNQQIDEAGEREFDRIDAETDQQVLQQIAAGEIAEPQASEYLVDYFSRNPDDFLTVSMLLAMDASQKGPAMQNRDLYERRGLADRITHAKALAALQAMPRKVVTHLADIVYPQSPSQTFDDRLPAMDAAMRDIHGDDDVECDSNGGA